MPLASSPSQESFVFACKVERDGLLGRPEGLAGDGHVDVEDSEDELEVDELGLSESLRDGDERLRYSALQVLRDRGPAVTANFSSELVDLLQDPECDVQALALELLLLLDTSSLSDLNVEGLLGLLSHPDCLVQRASLEVLRTLPSSVLSLRAERIVGGLVCSETTTRHAARQLLFRLDPYILGDFLQVFLDGLRDEVPGVRYICLEALGLLSKEEYNSLSVSLSVLQSLEDPDILIRRAAAEHICRLEPSILSKSLRLLECSEEGDSGDTILHIAARDGHLELCRRLVMLGAMVKVHNRHGQTPAEVALLYHHIDVHNFLAQTGKCPGSRGGRGDALAPALADMRPVIKAEWYTTALPGFIGQAGAVHSLVAVTVADGSGQEPATYTIEKAAGTGTLVCYFPDGADRFKNGVLVSYWQDVASGLLRLLHSVEGDDIANNTGEPQLSLRALRSLAVGLGPYNVATCNCHHAALTVFNACAKKAVQVPRIPNQSLTFLAGILGTLGFNMGEAQLGGHCEDTVPGPVRQKFLGVVSSSILPVADGDQEEFMEEVSAVDVNSTLSPTAAAAIGPEPMRPRSSPQCAGPFQCINI